MKHSSDSERRRLTKSFARAGFGLTRSSRQFSTNSVTHRRPRQLAAVFAVVALIATGAVPAYAEDAPEEQPIVATQAQAETPAPPVEEPVEPEPPVVEEPPVTPPPPPPAEPTPPAPSPEPAPPAEPEPEPEVTEPKVTAPEAKQKEAPAPAADVEDDAKQAEPELPYLKWRAVDEAGATLTDVTFKLEGPRTPGMKDDEENPDAPWTAGLSMTVIDNIGQEGYVGADQDPAPGVFLVEELTHDADQTRTYEVAAEDQFRVRPATAPAGLQVLDDAEWTQFDAATTSETPVDIVTLVSVEPAEQTVQPLAAEDSLIMPMAAPPGAAAMGVYTSAGDRTNPTGWYSAGDPAEAAKLLTFTTDFEQVGQNWTLNATWTRPQGTGSMGWSLEYTNAPERWGGDNRGDNVLVPQPDRSRGGMVIFVHNDNSGNFTAQICRYTSQNNYPTGSGASTCRSISPSPITSENDGKTLHLSFTLTGDLVGTIGCPPTLGSTGYVRSWTGGNNHSSRNVQAWVAPVAVDPPSNCGDTTLRITKMGDRTTTNLIPGNNLTQGTPVPGAVYEAYTDSNGQPSGPSLGTCTTAANGVCEIVLSNGISANEVWVVETSTPTGWSQITSLGTGDYNSTKSVTPYQFRVSMGTGSNDVTRNVTADANRPNTNLSGAWVNMRNNPPFPEYCGLNLAMVFDKSTSIDSREMELFRDAAKLFVGSTGLGGTPSHATMFSFNTTASTINSGNSYDLSTPGSSGGNTGYLGAIEQIEDQLSGSGSGYTNWDAALRLVKSTGNYDLVLFMTDGDPTTYGNGNNTSTNVHFRNVEQAVLSANALKNSVAPSGGTTKIVGVGVGLATNSDLNLKAITGPDINDDYFLADGFGGLEALLSEIALKNCGNTLTVIKEIQNADGDVITENAAGWEFTATGDVVNGTTAVQTTTNSGTVFNLTFNDSDLHTVSVSETPQSQYEYIGSRCTNAGGDVVETASGFTVELKYGMITSCTVTNREIPQDAELIWKKSDDQTPANMLGGSEWTILGPGHPEPGTVITDCVAADPEDCTGLDQDPAAGGFKLGELGMGDYTVTETKTPDGHSGTNSFTFTVNAETAGTVIDKGTFVNPRLTGTVIWTKISAMDDSLLSGSEWKIIGPAPATTELLIEDCVEAPCTGFEDQDPAGGQFKIEGLAWGSYTLVETKTPPGHLLDTTEHDFSVTVDNVSAVIDLGDIENVPATPPTIPLTGGIGTDQVLLAGAILLALALFGGIALQRRHRLMRGTTST